MPNRMIASGTNALANSVLPVCRKKEASAEVIPRAEFIRALNRDLPPPLPGLQAANIAPFTPHDLRRTFAGDLLHANVDIVTVQKLLGHSNPATTAGYDRRGARARQEAVKHIHVPYTGRAPNR